MSAAGRDVTSPADTLRALLDKAEMRWMSMEDAEITMRARDVVLMLRPYLALLDAAQALKGHMLLAQTPVRPRLFIDFVQALDSLTEPRP